MTTTPRITDSLLPDFPYWKVTGGVDYAVREALNALDLSPVANWYDPDAIPEPVFAAILDFYGVAGLDTQIFGLDFRRRILAANATLRRFRGTEFVLEQFSASTGVIYTYTIGRDRRHRRCRQHPVHHHAAPGRNALRQLAGLHAPGLPLAAAAPAGHPGLPGDVDVRGAALRLRRRQAQAPDQLMPDLTKTTAGITRLLQAGVQPTHLQYGSVAVVAGDLVSRTSVGGVLVTVAVTEAVVDNESQFIGVDDTDANAYTTFRTLGLWHVPDGSNPGDAESVLLGIGSTGNATTYGDKVANIDLIVSGSIQLTDAEAANITFGSGTVLQATETRHGTTRYSTDAEDDDGTAENRSSTPKGVKRYVAGWWSALTSLHLRNKIVMATAQQARAGSGTGVMTSELTSEAIGALSPDATTAVKGQVELATSNELRDALGGTNPPSAVENNVATLQALYDRRGDFGPKHTRVTAAPTPAQIAASDPGDIWTQVA